MMSTRLAGVPWSQRQTDVITMNQNVAVRSFTPEFGKMCINRPAGGLVGLVGRGSPCTPFSLKTNFDFDSPHCHWQYSCGFCSSVKFLFCSLSSDSYVFPIFESCVFQLNPDLAGIFVF